MADEIAFGGRPMTKEEEDEWKLQQQQQPELQPPPKRPEVTNPVERIATDNVQNFIEENIYVPLVDTVDNLLGDKRSTEQIRSDRKDLNTKVAEKQAATAATIEETAYANPLATAYSETLRAGLGGIEEFWEGNLEALHYLGDWSKALKSTVSPTRLMGLTSGLEEKDIPWSSTYESVDYEFNLIKENKTPVGQFTRHAVGFILQLRQLHKAQAKLGIPNLPKGPNIATSVSSRIGTEFLRGGIVEFFRHPGEGNLGNLLEEGITNEDGSLMKYWNFLPVVGGKDLLKHPDLLFFAALKHKDDDNDLIRKLKNVIEGGPFDIMTDGIGELYHAWKGGLRKGIEYQARTGEKGGDIALNETAKLLYERTEGPSGVNTVTPSTVDLDPTNVRIGEKTIGELKALSDDDQLKYLESLSKEDLQNATNALASNLNRIDPNALAREFPNIKFNLEPQTPNAIIKSLGDTRGKGEFYHGAADEFKLDDTGHFESDTGIYGQGFYTTDDVRTASKYRKKNRKSSSKDANPTVYKLTENQPVKFYDLDQEVDEGTLNLLIESSQTKPGYVEDAVDLVVNQDKKPLTLANVIDKMRDIDRSSGVNRLEFQDIIDSFKERLQGQGFGGFTHVGGRLAGKGKRLHQVRIYWDPSEQVKINQLETDPTQRPGYVERKVKQDTQPSRGEDGATDPTERIGRTTEYSLNEAAKSQETKVFDQTLVGGSNPSVNDATVRRLKEMSQPELIEYIKVRSPQISIDEIARSVSKQPEQYVQEALLGLARFATDGKVDHIANLGNYWREVHRFDQEGIAVIRVLSNDVSEQMYDLAEYMLQLDGIDESLRKASIQYLERAKVLMKLKKEASSDSGFGLLNWWVKKIPPDMHASIKKANAEIDAVFDNYLKVFEDGDTIGMLEIRDDFLEFARGTVASQGDPTQIVSFFSSMMRVGIRNANQAVINAWLSSPVSQVRNLAGNAIVAAERPFATAAGHAFVGEWKEARAAFSMLDSIHISGLEALRVARKSLGSDIPITEGNKLAEFTEFSSQTRRDIDNLHRVASNPAQKFVAHLFDWHYTLINLPWNTWPGRGLQSGDDFFKALTAQMDLRYEAALAADGHIFKNRTQANAEYKRLLLEKIGPNGEILDPTLKYNAQEATFQLDLEGKMARVANSLNAHPEMKQFIPFIRTPHNINVFASQHIPLPYGEKLIPGFGREYDEIMKNGTAQQRALLRGRKAVGGLLVTYGFAMAANGMLTGNGPSDPELRELWRRYNEPMSIKVGEDEDGNPIWQSYRSIPGADLIFSLIADTQFLVQYLPEAEGGKMLGQLMYTISQSITNRSTLAGFIELAGFLDGENWTLRGIGRSSGDWANDLLPIFGGSGLRRQFENAQADGIYEYRNTLEAIKGRVTAGIIGDKVPVMDILTGKQMLRGTEGWGNFLNPFRTVHKDAHPVARRLGDLRYELNRGNVEYVKDGRVREPLTIEEQQFIREHTYNNGKLVKDLENYLNSDKFKNYYQQWEDDKGTVDQKTRQNSEWYRKISEIIHFHRRQATKKLRSDNTDPVALEFQTRVRLANDDADRQRTLKRATPR